LNEIVLVLARARLRAHTEKIREHGGLEQHTPMVVDLRRREDRSSRPIGVLSLEICGSASIVEYSMSRQPDEDFDAAMR
jgi:hypothetical protein